MSQLHQKNKTAIYKYLSQWKMSFWMGPKTSISTFLCRLFDTILFFPNNYYSFQKYIENFRTVVNFRITVREKSSPRVYISLKLNKHPPKQPKSDISQPENLWATYKQWTLKCERILVALELQLLNGDKVLSSGDDNAGKKIAFFAPCGFPAGMPNKYDSRRQSFGNVNPARWITRAHCFHRIIYSREFCFFLRKLRDASTTRVYLRHRNVRAGCCQRLNFAHNK